MSNLTKNIGKDLGLQLGLARTITNETKDGTGLQFLTITKEALAILGLNIEELDAENGGEQMAKALGEAINTEAINKLRKQEITVLVDGDALTNNQIIGAAFEHPTDITSRVLKLESASMDLAVQDEKNGGLIAKGEGLM